MLMLERSGCPEETYHTFSYSPLLGDQGKVEGLFCAVSEETGRVHQRAAARTAAARSAPACQRDRHAPGRGRRDPPTALGRAPARPAVRADVPVRRGRRRPSAAARPASHDGHALAPQSADARQPRHPGPSTGCWQARRRSWSRSTLAPDVPCGPWDPPSPAAFVVAAAAAGRGAAGRLPGVRHQPLPADHRRLPELRAAAGRPDRAQPAPTPKRSRPAPPSATACAACSARRRASCAC